jgi:hypothetical protein
MQLMRTFKYFVQNNVHIRVCNEDGSVEVQDEGCWISMMMTREEEVNDSKQEEEQRGKKRSYLQITTTDSSDSIVKKRKRYSFDCLFPELILHILSFSDYVQVKPKELIYIPDVYGRFSDGSIHSLYLNIKIRKEFHPYLDDMILVLRHARIIDVWCHVPAYTLSKLHLLCPSVERIYFWITNEFKIQDIQNIISKIWVIRIMKEHLPHMDLLCTIPHLWFHDLCMTEKEIRQLLSQCKGQGVHFCDLDIVDECTFPLDAVRSHKYIRDIEIYNNTYSPYSFNNKDLENLQGLRSIQIMLDASQLELVAKNSNIRKLSLYLMDKELIPIIKSMKLETLEIYLRPDDVKAFVKLIQTEPSIKYIDVLYWLDEMESFSVGSAVDLVNTFQHRNIYVKALD